MTPETFNQYLNDNAQALDISPTMFKEATEHYQAVANYLSAKGIPADFYPHGSFATGTVVRPYSKDPDGYFDLDIVAKRSEFDENSSMPSQVRLPVDRALSSGFYSDKLSTCDECATIEYSRDGNVGGFNLDIVVAARGNGGSTDISDPLQIACLSNHWLASNPKALIAWFRTVNAPFAAYSSKEYRMRLFKQHRDIYASVEDVPADMERTSLQRVIQILKRSRDIYCEIANYDGELIPSCVIMTMAGNIANRESPSLDTAGLLKVVVLGINTAIGRGKEAINLLLADPVDPSTGQSLVIWHKDDMDLVTLSRWAKTLDELSNVNLTDDKAVSSQLTRNFGNRAKKPSYVGLSPTAIARPTKPWSC